jgi:hypothetical protein
VHDRLKRVVAIVEEGRGCSLKQQPSIYATRFKQHAARMLGLCLHLKCGAALLRFEMVQQQDSCSISGSLEMSLRGFIQGSDSVFFSFLLLSVLPHQIMKSVISMSLFALAEQCPFSTSLLAQLGVWVRKQVDGVGHQLEPFIADPNPPLELPYPTSDLPERARLVSLDSSDGKRITVSLLDFLNVF